MIRGHQWMQVQPFLFDWRKLQEGVVETGGGRSQGTHTILLHLPLSGCALQTSQEDPSSPDILIGKRSVWLIYIPRSLTYA